MRGILSSPRSLSAKPSDRQATRAPLLLLLSLTGTSSHFSHPNTTTNQTMDRMKIPEFFESVTFCGSPRHSDACGSNGLPVTPSSITMIGRFKGYVCERRVPGFRTDDHRDRPTDGSQHLVSYVDCFRNRHERVTLVYEHLPLRDWSAFPTREQRSQELEILVQHMLLALHHLHYEKYLRHGNISPSSFVFDGSQYKLKHWCLNFVTANASLLDSDALFPDDIRFSSPERINHPSRPPIMKSDVWSLALSVLSLMFPTSRLPDNPVDLTHLTDSRAVLRRLGLSEQDMPSSAWHSFFQQSLQPIVSKRSSVKQLLTIFHIKPPVFQYNRFESSRRYDKLSLSCVTDDSVVQPLDLDECYYLLCLANPGFKETQQTNSSSSNGSRSPNDKQSPNNQSLPAILTLPLVVPLNPVSLSSQSSSSSIPSPDSSSFTSIPSDCCLISAKPLRDRLSEIDAEIFFPLVLFSTAEEKERRSRHVRQKELPLAIRENDFAYQTERLILFKSLIEGCPYARPQLVQYSETDISPLHRPFIWSAILCVSQSLMQEYESLVGQESESQTERQISVDIPRCHQYKELLASDSGHKKLTRVLKAWLAKNQDRGYVYWQGLDSLSAPFILLNFNDESRAFACFHRLTQQFLPGFFARDNSLVMQDFLSFFSRLMAFHMPDLFAHLEREIGFTPELYAIPWFLTLFTHVLPLDKTILVWDTLLLSKDQSFVLFLGLAILLQLRSQLLHLSFNDCILMFSDLPDLSIDRLVGDAVTFSHTTPVSCATHSRPALDPVLSCPVLLMPDLVHCMTQPDKRDRRHRHQESGDEGGVRSDPRITGRE